MGKFVMSAKTNQNVKKQTRPDYKKDYYGIDIINRSNPKIDEVTLMSEPWVANAKFTVGDDTVYSFIQLNSESSRFGKPTTLNVYVGTAEGNEKLHEQFDKYFNGGVNRVDPKIFIDAFNSAGEGIPDDDIKNGTFDSIKFYQEK